MKKQIFISLGVLILTAQFFALAPKVNADGEAILSIPAGTYEAAPGGMVTIPVDINVDSVSPAPSDVDWHFILNPDDIDVNSINAMSNDQNILISTCSDYGSAGVGNLEDIECTFGTGASSPLPTEELAEIQMTFTDSTTADSTELQFVDNSTMSASDVDRNPVSIVADPVSTTLTIDQSSPSAPDTTSPLVTLTVPAAGSVLNGTNVNIAATSTDNVGVAGVTFYYDSTNKIGSEITATSSPDTYSATWDTTSVPDGTHTLIAVSRDLSNNYATSSAVSVTVSNVAPSVAVAASNGPIAGTYGVVNSENSAIVIGSETGVSSATSTASLLSETSTGQLSIENVKEILQQLTVAVLQMQFKLLQFELGR